MERLTRVDEDGTVLCIGCVEEEECNEDCLSCQHDIDAIEKLADYEDAEEQGLLLRLPCKVGDTVYTACSWGIESGVVGSIEIIGDMIFVNNPYRAMIGQAHNIFLTKEEAEQALARMEK